MRSAEITLARGLEILLSARTYSTVPHMASPMMAERFSVYLRKQKASEDCAHHRHDSIRTPTPSTALGWTPIHERGVREDGSHLFFR